MRASINTALAKLSQAWIVALAIAGVGLVGLIDYLTGQEISFSVFYLGPVALATWYGSRRYGFLISVLSSAVWIAADLNAGHLYTYEVIAIWNGLVRLAFYLISAALLAALRERLDSEQLLASTDGLTGVLNSRAFGERLQFSLALSGRDGRPVTLAYVDLDDFKRINDLHGHSAGDMVLKTVAKTLMDITRRTDTVARVGGDEFALLLPNTDLDGAQNVISKLEHHLREKMRSGSSPVTCSIGAVTFSKPPVSVDEALRAADGLMYKVKREGKNAVAFHILDASAGEAVEPGTSREKRQRRVQPS
jgi:diguanylate cyclase (GGDEF)-like protein